MILEWFNGREAAEIGAALADEFAPRADPPSRRSTAASTSASMEQLLRRADSEVRPLQLNFYKKAKFANSFKWRLIENGVARKIADEVTQSLVLHLSQNQIPADQSRRRPANRPDTGQGSTALRQGNKCFARAHMLRPQTLSGSGRARPSHAEALNNLGSALSHLGRYEEAEHAFARRCDKAELPGSARQSWDSAATEGRSRRIRSIAAARPQVEAEDLEARINLGIDSQFLGRMRDARAYFTKVLKTAPRDVRALVGMGQIADVEGRFEEAETTFKRVIEINPKMTECLGGSCRHSQDDDCRREWLKGAEEIATSAIHPLEEANLRFAIGKYCDDVGDFRAGFSEFQARQRVVEDCCGRI